MILIVSDIHLDERTPALTNLFLHFLADQAIRAQKLYILGDLFEVWVGDDEQTELHQTIQNALKTLSQQGVEIFFVHGNRDFLIGKRFAKAAGLTLLPTLNIVDIYDTKTLLMHGDTLCTDDIHYQLYRKIVHNKFIQFLFNRLPLNWRKKIAVKLRNTSKHANKNKAEAIMDVNQSTVLNTFRQYSVFKLVHGHTHHPGKHQYDLQGHTAERIVLGAWHDEGSVLVCQPNQRWELKTV